jgi:hypothetical protein
MEFWVEVKLEEDGTLPDGPETQIERADPKMLENGTELVVVELGKSEHFLGDIISDIVV